MNVLVVTTKGGSGKSTIAQQVLAPMLSSALTDSVVKLVEIDPMNWDCLSLAESRLFEPVALRPEEAPEKIPELLFSGVPLVIDVGGNITAKDSLDFLTKSAALEAVDLVVIPSSFGKQDVLNARSLYEQLSVVAPTVVALNMAKDPEKPKAQFPFFFGYAEIEPLFDPQRTPYVVIPFTELVNYSKAYGLTIAEIAEEPVETLRQELKEAIRQKDSEKAKFLVERIYLIERAREFMKYVSKSVWPRLEQAAKVKEE